MTCGSDCRLRLGALYIGQLGGPRSVNIFRCSPPPPPLFMLLLFRGPYRSTFSVLELKNKGPGIQDGAPWGLGPGAADGRALFDVSLSPPLLPPLLAGLLPKDSREELALRGEEVAAVASQYNFPLPAPHKPPSEKGLMKLSGCLHDSSLPSGQSQCVCWVCL